MSCFPCFKDKKNFSDEEEEVLKVANVPEKKAENFSPYTSPKLSGNAKSQTFTFRQLATATKNFSPDNLVGEGGFGRVYKGCLQNSDQVVAIKQLDRNNLHGNKEFLNEVLMLSLLDHPNLVNLVGYCADGDQRALVYEFMSQGTLENHLFNNSPDKEPLSWYTRMKIAYGTAQGLEYLHDRANPPVIYRDLKPSNILLGEALNPKLADFGLAKLGAMGDNVNCSSRVMGTYGYCTPEYVRTGQISLKSDVYSFGIVLLELITGRRVIDPSRPIRDQNLLTWAEPMFKDQKRYPQLVDPKLKGDFHLKGLNQAVAIAAMCIQDEPSVRPLMQDVVMTLSYLTEPPTSPDSSAYYTPGRHPFGNHSASSSYSDFADDSSPRVVVETLQLGLVARRNRALRESSANCLSPVDGSSGCVDGSEGKSPGSGRSESPSSKHSDGGSVLGNGELESGLNASSKRE